MLALLLLAGLATLLSARSLTDRAPPPRQNAPRWVEGEWVIPPGRERITLEILGPALRDGVSGRSVTSVQIRGSEVRALLEGGGALVLRAEGELTPALVVGFEDVAADPAMREQLAHRSAAELYVARGGPRASPVSTEPAPDTSEARTSHGLLTSAARLTGVQPSFLIIAALLLGFVGCLAAARAVPPGEIDRSRRTSGWVLGAICIGVALRAALAALLPIETDESAPLESAMALVSSSHDSWLHPPLYRAVATSWVELCGWHGGDSALLLRAPSLVFSSIGAAFVAFAVQRVSPRPSLATFALLPTLVAPTFVADSVLARPYALVCMLAGVVLWSVATPRVTRSGAVVALFAAGLAAWTDVVAGALLGIVVVSWMFRAPGRARAIGPAAALTLLVFAAPLVPGVLEAASHPVLDEPVGDAVALAQQPEFGMARDGMKSLVSRAAAFAVAGIDARWLGLPALLVVMLALFRVARRRWDLGVAFAASLLGTIAIAATRSVRPRNVLELTMIFALLLACALVRESGRSRAGEGT